LCSSLTTKEKNAERFRKNEKSFPDLKTAGHTDGTDWFGETKNRRKRRQRRLLLVLPPEKSLFSSLAVVSERRADGTPATTAALLQHDQQRVAALDFKMRHEFH
jgi:hypothetical protein